MSKSNNALQQEFSEWFDRYADAIFRHCYFRLHDRERAADLMQETFMRSWSYVTRGGTIHQPRAFLYKTANNLIINEYERRKPTSSLETLDEEIGFEPAAEDRHEISSEIDAQIVLEHLGKENEAYRDVLVMRYIDGLSVSEMATVLEESENTTSVRIHRALKKLKSITERNE